MTPEQEAQSIIDTAKRNIDRAAATADPTKTDTREGWISKTARFATRAGWLCHLCGIMQPGWAGDCLTCERHDMMGDRD